MATFITSKPVGQTIQISVKTSTSWWKYFHNNQYSSAIAANAETIIQVESANGEFTIVSCLSDGTESGSVTELNLRAINSINQITSFNGTGLSALVALDLRNNESTLTSFDGTGLTSLTSLDLRFNELLTTLILTGLTSLTFLDLRNTNIPTLTLSDLDVPNLETLYLLGSNITSLTLSNLPNLVSIVTQGAMESLQTISLTNLPQVQTLGIGNSLLSSLTIDNLTSLTNLDIFDGGDLGTFSLTDVPSLGVINIQNTQTTNFSLSNVPSLYRFYLITNPQLTSVTLSGVPLLAETYLYQNQLTGFDGSNLTSATGSVDSPNTILHLGENQITDLSNIILNENIHTIELGDNGISSITSSDLTEFLNIKDLRLSNNQLLTLDLTSLVTLEKLSLSNTGIQSVENLPTSLTWLDLSQNEISQIDFTDLSNLKSVFLYQNSITNFNNISGLSLNLEEIDLGQNSLTTIDVSPFTNLIGLYLYNNLFSSIDVSELINLQYLDVSNSDLTGNFNLNTISDLNVTGLTQLKQITASWNQITSLDVTGLTNLTDIYLDGCNLTPSGADLLLNSLYNSIPSGNGGNIYAVLAARTSNSDTAYNDLQSVSNWAINETDWQDEGPLTFVTSKLPGETIEGYVQSSNGFKVVYWDATEETKEASDFFSKTIDINDTSNNRSVQLIPFDSNNNRQQGNINFVTIDNCHINNIDLTNQRVLNSLSLVNVNTPTFTPTAQLNDLVLNQLAQTYKVGSLYTLGERTGASTVAYNLLIDRGWDLGVYVVIKFGPRFSTKFIPPGDPTPAGWVKVGNIAVDVDGVGDTEPGTVAGINPDYDTSGYIITTDTTTAGLVGRSTGAGSGTASPDTPTYWVSLTKDSGGFLDLVNNLPARIGQTPFNIVTDALDWLNANGYWTSYEV